MKYKNKWVKKCSVCGKVIRGHNKSGLCYYHFRKRYYQENKKEIRKKQKVYYQKNKERIKKHNLENYYIKKREDLLRKVKNEI